MNFPYFNAGQNGIHKTVTMAEKNDAKRSGETAENQCSESRRYSNKPRSGWSSKGPSVLRQHNSATTTNTALRQSGGFFNLGPDTLGQTQDTSLFENRDPRRGVAPTLPRSPEMAEAVKQPSSYYSGQAYGFPPLTPSTPTPMPQQNSIFEDGSWRNMIVSGRPPRRVSPASSFAGETWSQASSGSRRSSKGVSFGRNSNEEDMNEFANKYGLIGQVSPTHLYQPRKGKYFKEF